MEVLKRKREENASEPPKVQRHNMEWTMWGTIGSLISAQNSRWGTQWLEKQCGQDGENLLGHVKEPTHSSAARGCHWGVILSNKVKKTCSLNCFYCWKGNIRSKETSWTTAAVAVEKKDEVRKKKEEDVFYLLPKSFKTDGRIKATTETAKCLVP